MTSIGYGGGMVNPGGKVTEIAASVMLLPAKCLSCGVGSYDVDKRFLDLHTDIEEYGCVYFCLDCAAEVGIAGGNAPMVDFQQISLANEQLTKENASLTTYVSQMGDILESDILSYIAGRLGSITNPDISNSKDSEPSPELNDEFLFGSDGDVDSEPESTTTVASDDSESNESVEGDGPYDADELADSNTNSRPEPYLPTIEL